MEKNPDHRRKYEVWQPLLLALTISTGMLIGLKINQDKGDFSLIEKVSTEDLARPGRVEEVLRFIESKYVDDVDDEQIVERAVRAVFEELDPHSMYISPERMKEVNDQMQGSYRGIGIETVYFDDTLIVTEVLEGGPAEIAGIAKFDRIISVSDTIISGAGLDYEEIKRYLVGNEGDSMLLRIQRDSPDDMIDAKLVISDVPVKSADIAFMVDDSIGYIQIKRFNANVYREFMESLEMLTKNESFRHLIVDVRQNPGGYLPETTNIISQLFDEKGLLIVYTKGRNERMTTYRTTGKTFFNVGKIAVLIDEGSASGSEILAGAIQDWDRGVVVGRRSFGKGLVQEQYDLKNGGAIRLTVARYYTPSGRSIQRSYDDPSKYSRFIEERWNHGELMEKDSISVADTTRFFTKKLGRVVYGGGGIIPDAFVSIDSMIFNTEYLVISDYIPGFAYSVARQMKEQLPEDFEDLTYRHLNMTGILRQFENHYISRTGLSDYRIPEDLKGQVQAEIEASVIKVLYGELCEERWESRYDAHVLEAVRHLRMTGHLAELSAGK